jgi:hypothetical protein
MNQTPTFERTALFSTLSSIMEIRAIDLHCSPRNANALITTLMRAGVYRDLLNVGLLYNQKNVLNIWLENNYIISHRLVHTSKCFGPVYCPLSGCITNLISNYTICAYCIITY